MAKATSGITTETTQNFLIDAGALYINLYEPTERLVSATRGGNAFVVEQEVKIVEMDSAKGAVRGARRVISVNARITSNLLEMTTENLALMLPGATVGTETVDLVAYDTLTRTRNIIDTDYITNVAIVGKISGTNENFVGIIYNALADGNLEITKEDKEEAVLSVQFTAHFDPANMDLEPWEIRRP